MLSAQLTLGTTGLLNSPSADMQPDKTVMLGGNFLHDRITPNGFPYNTYNYFLNITFLPFLEVAYTCTLFKATDKFVPEKKVCQSRSCFFCSFTGADGKKIPSGGCSRVK